MGAHNRAAYGLLPADAFLAAPSGVMLSWEQVKIEADPTCTATISSNLNVVIYAFSNWGAISGKGAKNVNLVLKAAYYGR